MTATTMTRRPRPTETRPTEPTTAGELVEVLDTMYAVLGPPERMTSPHARAVYLLDLSRLAAASRTENRR